MAAAILTTAPIAPVVQWIFWFVFGVAAVMDWIEFTKK